MNGQKLGIGPGQIWRMRPRSQEGLAAPLNSHLGTLWEAKARSMHSSDKPEELERCDGSAAGCVLRRVYAFIP